MEDVEMEEQPKKPRKRGINGRNKGATAEREVAHLLQPIVESAYYDCGLYSAVPVVERNLEQTRGGGWDLNGLLGFAPEVKRVEAVTTGNLAKWWAQAQKQALTPKYALTPLLIYRKNGTAWQVKMFVKLGALNVAATFAWDDFAVWLYAELCERLRLPIVAKVA
jgi:hypothetical protein